MSDQIIPRETITGILSSECPMHGSLAANSCMTGGVSTSGEIEPANIHGRITLPGVRYIVEKDYEKLINHPSINEVELIKDKSFDDLGLNALSNMELENLLT